MPKQRLTPLERLGIRRNRWAAACVAVVLLIAAQLQQSVDTNATGEVTATSNEREATGRVSKVADGDTITVLSEQGQKLKIRLLGIDAPETNQKHGKAAGSWLREQLLDQQVLLQIVETDRYQRHVAKVLAKAVDCKTATCPLERDINLELVKLGHAWWYERYSNNQPIADQTAYPRAQQLAKRNRMGLWAHPDPIPPWEFRRQQRENRK